MAYKREIRVNVDDLLKTLKEGIICEEDLERANKAIEEYERVGPIVREWEIRTIEHGFWECPVCRRILNDAPAEFDICPFCKYKLTTEEVENQKKCMRRTKKTY